MSQGSDVLRALPSKITHVRQRDSWDCGVTCLQMISKAAGLDVSREDIATALKTEVCTARFVVISLAPLINLYLHLSAGSISLFSLTFSHRMPFSSFFVCRAHGLLIWPGICERLDFPQCFARKPSALTTT